MQMRHALPRQRSHALRHNQRQPFDHAAFLLRHPARLQPKDSYGQRAIDSRLRLFIVHPNYG